MQKHAWKVHIGIRIVQIGLQTVQICIRNAHIGA